MGLGLLWLILAVGVWALLRLTDYRDLAPESHRDLVVRAQRGTR